MRALSFSGTPTVCPSIGLSTEYCIETLWSGGQCFNMRPRLLDVTRNTEARIIRQCLFLPLLPQASLLQANMEEMTRLETVHQFLAYSPDLEKEHLFRGKKENKPNRKG